MARYFNLSTDHILASSGGPTDTNNFTMFGMFRKTSYAGSGAILYVGYGTSAGGGYGMYLKGGASQGTLRIDIGFVADYNSGLYAIPNQWNRALCTRTSGGTWQLWLNGVKSGTTSSSNPFTPNGLYTIGARPNSDASAFGQQFTGGAIAEVAFWGGVVFSDAICKALTSGFLLPKDLYTTELKQYHQLLPTWGSTYEPFTFKGSVMTRTGTSPFWHPVPVPSFLNYYNSNPVVGGTVVQDLIQAGFIPFAR